MMKAKHKNVSKNKTKKYHNDLQKQNTRGVKKKYVSQLMIHKSKTQKGVKNNKK